MNRKKKKPRRRVRWWLLLIPAALIAAVAWLIMAPRMKENSTLKELGYTKEEISAIREYGITSDLIENKWYSASLAENIRKHTLNKDYLNLYASVPEDVTLTETDFLLARRLADCGYEHDQIENLYSQLRFWEMTPLLLFDYQWDETKYIEDCIKHRDTNSVDSFTLSGNYHRNYRYTYQTDTSVPEIMLVNRNYYLTEAYTPKDVTQISSKYAVPGQSLAKVAADAFTEMCEAGISNGTSFFMAASYTSYESQKSQYDKQVKLVGEEKADSTVLRPGFNEHQTGMCVNVSSTYETKVKFADSNTRAWLRGICSNYGWIERYPSEKAVITGVRDEPGHYRYLGKDLAVRVVESKLTYDEYYCLYLKGWMDETLIPAEEVLKKTDYGLVSSKEETASPEETAQPEETAKPEESAPTEETKDPQS